MTDKENRMIEDFFKQEKMANYLKENGYDR